ncbi:MAG TPA: hypothetical protein VG317_02015 [Pseudonocardiaceae bacterium]|nr:hypothetical protein [Pseudonocardiaceae bacterium]
MGLRGQGGNLRALVALSSLVREGQGIRQVGEGAAPERQLPGQFVPSEPGGRVVGRIIGSASEVAGRAVRRCRRVGVRLDDRPVLGGQLVGQQVQRALVRRALVHDQQQLVVVAAAVDQGGSYWRLAGQFEPAEQQFLDERGSAAGALGRPQQVQFGELGRWRGPGQFAHHHNPIHKGQCDTHDPVPGQHRPGGQDERLRVDRNRARASTRPGARPTGPAPADRETIIDAAVALPGSRRRRFRGYHLSRPLLAPAPGAPSQLAESRSCPRRSG